MKKAAIKAAQPALSRGVVSSILRDGRLAVKVCRHNRAVTAVLSVKAECRIWASSCAGLFGKCGTWLRIAAEGRDSKSAEERCTKMQQRATSCCSKA